MSNFYSGFLHRLHFVFHRAFRQRTIRPYQEQSIYRVTDKPLYTSRRRIWVTLEAHWMNV